MNMRYQQKLRISRCEIMTKPCRSLAEMLIGKGILNNKDIIRKDDLDTGDIVFYEPIKEAV